MNCAKDGIGSIPERVWFFGSINTQKIPWTHEILILNARIVSTWADEKTWIKPYRPVNEAKVWTWRHVWHTLEMKTLRLGRCRHINMPHGTSPWVCFVSKLSKTTISWKKAFKSGSILINGQNEYFLIIPAQKAQNGQKVSIPTSIWRFFMGLFIWVTDQI